MTLGRRVPCLTLEDRVVLWSLVVCVCRRWTEAFKFSRHFARKLAAGSRARPGVAAGRAGCRQSSRSITIKPRVPHARAYSSIIAKEMAQEEEERFDSMLMAMAQQHPGGINDVRPEPMAICRKENMSAVFWRMDIAVPASGHLLWLLEKKNRLLCWCTEGCSTESEKLSRSPQIYLTRGLIGVSCFIQILVEKFHQHQKIALKVSAFWHFVIFHFFFVFFFLVSPFLISFFLFLFHFLASLSSFHLFICFDLPTTFYFSWHPYTIISHHKHPTALLPDPLTLFSHTKISHFTNVFKESQTSFVP